MILPNALIIKLKYFSILFIIACIYVCIIIIIDKKKLFTLKMNRIYLIGSDGRVWFGEKTSGSFELLDLDGNDDINSEDSNTTDEELQNRKSSTLIKRLSSCEWCLWLITASFKVNLFVFNLDTPFEWQETSYQNQV